MKKSELYHLAQIAVVTSTPISVTEKLEILKELMAAESHAKWCEEQEEKK